MQKKESFAEAPECKENNRTDPRLIRFLELSIRKNCPFVALKPDDRLIVLSAFKWWSQLKSMLGNFESFLLGPASWLQADENLLVSEMEEKSRFLFPEIFQGQDLEELVEQRRKEQRDFYKNRALAKERSNRERIMAEQTDDERFMKEALIEAKKALEKEEVPIGAVVVLNNEIIGRGHNSVISSKDPTAHAEVMAIREAASKLENYRLTDADIYVTLEPCPMCAGAILNARLKRVVWGAPASIDNKCCGSQAVFKTKKVDEIPYIFKGVLEAECKSMLQDFFSKKRST